MYKNYLLFLFLCLIKSNITFAQKNNNFTTILLNNNIIHNIKNNIAYIEDKESIYSIQQMDSLFKIIPLKTLQKPNANFYQTYSSYWFRFEVKIEQVNPKIDWLLKIDYALLDYIDFYYQDTNKVWQVKQQGDAYPFIEKEIIDKAFLFKIPFSDTNTHIFYVKIKTNSVFQAPFSFERSDEYFKNVLGEEVFLAILYGVFFTLFLYNLFLFFVLRDKLYILYIFFIASCSFLFSGLIGHNAQYLFFNSPFLTEITIIPASCLYFYSFILFTQYYLDLKRNLKIAYYILEFFKYISLLDMAFYIVTQETALANRILHIFMLSGVLVLTFIGFYAWYKKLPHSFYFAISFIFPILATIIYILKLANILPHIYITTHFTRIALALQGLVFSFALANKYKKIKNQLINTQKSQNEQLETKVRERTQEIEGLNQELLTQNEELQQSQEEILAQREFIQLKNKELESQNTKINSSINAASLIQKAILPHQSKKEQLLKQYFEINLPKDIVSGDFYWINEINNHLYIAVIDCTGHGVSGALMTVIAHSLLEKIVKIWNIHQPSKILDTLHQEVKNILRQDETNNSNGMDLSLIKIEKKAYNQYKIVFAGAKNGIYYKSPQHNNIQYLAGTRKGIGGFQNENVNFEEQTLFLTTDSLIYLTTDGFIDQNNQQRKKIGTKKYIEFLTICSEEKNMEKQKEFLLQKLYAQLKNTSQRDDICMFGIKL
ncbi:MAG: hypothetical protein EAZ85_03615 [Bacteroidetes bacterium]|nr:MAG: hypothetical protein EAZ85_03615 [Bacteroidota bacterium]TAG92638.1 MAG: hypothetical protein EAZ20_02370 [Bacteroidota bacterium]